MFARPRGQIARPRPAGAVKSRPMSDHAHHFPVLALVAIGVGAALGAWLRWWLGCGSTLFAHLPLGTLAANLAGGLPDRRGGGLLRHPHGLPPELRLFIVTGFSAG
jgi:CrcB protein